MEDGEDRGESPLISSSTGRVIPPAWLREAGGSVPTLKISHVHGAQATTLPPSVDDPGGILGEWKTHPTHGRDGGRSSWEGQVRVGVGDGEQRESQRMTLEQSTSPPFKLAPLTPGANWELLTSGWRREWHPTPVFLPGEFHGQRSLVGYSPWRHRESNTTERLT